MSDFTANPSNVAASSQNVQFQQMQVMDQLTQMINSANASCAKGTDCFNQQQIIDAQNEYNAAVITEKNAPQMVETARKNFLVASKGSAAANQELTSRYEKNGKAEKDKMTQQFDEWFKDMAHKIDTLTQHAQTTTTLQTSNKIARGNLAKIDENDVDATNELNLLERKIHFLAQYGKLFNDIEYYVKLVYWLAFLTWGACIIYERRFTLKTGGLFVLFTVIILMHDWIMNTAASVLSPFM
jgi:hypothetical protein